MELLQQYFSAWDPIYLGIFLLIFIPSLMQDIKNHEGSTLTPELRAKDGVKWTLIWAGISIAFGAVTYAMKGPELAMAYFTGWALEKSLALDNLFAIMGIMASFGLATSDKVHLQYKILHWGILGAIFFRTLFLGTGAFFVNLPTIDILGHPVNVVMVIFALVILWTVKSMWGDVWADEDDDEEEIDYTQHWSVKLVKKVWPVDPSIDSGKFFVKEAIPHGFDEIGYQVVKGGIRTFVTPLFLCLICVEIFDIIFSFDSMPIIIAVVKDPNIMITSTLMACAGLRALYFCIEALKAMFTHLDKAIIAILLFIVAKLLLVAVGFHIGNMFSLSMVGGLILAGIVASKLLPPKTA